MTDQNTNNRNSSNEIDDQLYDRICSSGSMYVTVMELSSTHGFAYLRFHEHRCAQLGVGVCADGLSRFEGELIRSGPHRFSLSHQLCDKGRDELRLESDDKSFVMVVRRMALMREGNTSLSPAISDARRKDFSLARATLGDAVNSGIGLLEKLRVGEIPSQRIMNRVLHALDTVASVVEHEQRLERALVSDLFRIINMRLSKIESEAPSTVSDRERLVEQMSEIQAKAIEILASTDRSIDLS